MYKCGKEMLAGSTCHSDKMATKNNSSPRRRQAPAEGAPIPERKHRKKKKNKFLWFLKKLFAVIVTTLISLFLVMIITGTIVTTALTVYVMDFMEESEGLTLTELESGSDTYLYSTKIDENGEEQLDVVQQFKTDVQRIPVSIDKIPQHARYAFVSVEDERFYSHDGVDYKRTFSAFLNMFLHFYDTQQGGSTITQQLIKNLTHAENDRGPQQKIREIFSAMQLEKSYSKDEILEEYLNYIGFGNAYNGIQKASIEYFGKNVEDITVPEAAVLAAIPKSPNYYGPQYSEYEDMGDGVKVQTLDGEANNKIRQRHVLWQMYKNGYITYDEYQEYLNTKILFTHDPEYKILHPEVDLEAMEREQTAFTWEVDAMIREAEKYLMETYNIDYEAAEKRLYKGGYRIYSTIDRRMQTYVEEQFLDFNNLLDPYYYRRNVDLNGDGVYDEKETLPHIAFVALRYDGSVMAHVGNWGAKTESLITDYVDTAPRQIGSTVKPITTYGLALETDHIHWGSVYRDEPTMEVNGKKWPENYGGSLTYASHNIYYFLQQSFNTVPAQLCEELTPAEVYKFATEKMGMDLEEQDEAVAPLSVGAFTYGLPLQNLVNAYIPYGNAGIYCDAHIISRIEDANHQIIYSNDGNAREAVSPETAWVMNRLLKNVMDNGTGSSGRLYSKVVVGKTGTTEDWNDSAFVGLTRDFASGVTVGYQGYRKDMRLPESFHAVTLWKSIIGNYIETNFTDTPADFEPCPTVVQSPMCTVSGLIAGEYCPKGITGYWKSTNRPACQGGHYVAPVIDDNTVGGDTGTGGGTGTGVDVGTGGGDTGTGGDAGGWGGDTGGGGDVGGGDVGGW